MRRFSQRTALVTLSEINITPLLDLAFVLLIIFVITTPLLEQGLNLRLPTGGTPDIREPNPNDIKVVEVNQQGRYMLSGAWMSLNQITDLLQKEARRNPKLSIDIKGDENTAYKHVFALIDKLSQAGLDQVSFRAHPAR